MDPATQDALDRQSPTMKAAKKRTKPKAKKKAKRPTKSKAKKTAKAKKPAAKKAAVVARPERLDMRLTKAEKAKINAKAKKTRRTVTSIVLEAIEKIR